MFTEAAPSEWEAAESLYSAVVCAVAKARKSARLVDWNRWLEQDCPRIVKGTGKLGMADMEIVMQWKITKGKFRPLMSLLRSNSDQDVEDATRKAFQLLDKKPRFRPPVEALCSLRGIGPATASAVLAHVRPQQYAFMSGNHARSLRPGFVPRVLTLPAFCFWPGLFIVSNRSHAPPVCLGVDLLQTRLWKAPD